MDGDGVRATIERLVYVGVESDRIIKNLPAEFKMENIEREPVDLDRYTKEAI